MSSTIYLQVIEGNKNTYASVINDLHPPIITRYIRLLPVTKLSPTVCMRVELYGCPWEGRTHTRTPTHPHYAFFNSLTFRTLHNSYQLLETLTPPEMTKHP